MRIYLLMVGETDHGPNGKVMGVFASLKEAQDIAREKVAREVKYDWDDPPPGATHFYGAGMWMDITEHKVAARIG